MSQGVARVVAGRYRLLRQLGRGGMGVVWHARDGLLARDVAIKEIQLPSTGAEQADPLASRALREARAAAQLKHPGIITVHDVVVDDGRPWIVMELIDGRSLGQTVGEDGALSEQRAALIGLRVLDALQAAHQRGILHRDVKPPNILLDGDRVVLTDFGIAAIDGATALTATGQMVGSPAYLAPERINGRPATAATDLWALGVTLYAAVVGRSPFQREDAQTTFAAVLTSHPARPAGAGRLWPAIHGLLAKDPARRLTADRAAVLLAAVAYPATAPDPRPSSRWPRRWRSRPVGAPPQAVQPPTLVEPPPASEPAAERSRAPAIRRISILAVAVLLVTASLVWLLPGWLNRGTAEDTTGSGWTPSAKPAVSPSHTRQTSQAPPAAPPGFMTVSVYGNIYYAVPRTWVFGTSGWVSYDDSRAGSRLQVYAGLSHVGAGESAIAHLTEAQKDFTDDEHYRRIRLADVAAARGASSVAEWEYTTALTDYPRWGYEHSMTKAIVLSNKETYIVTVSVKADTQSALTRDWPNARPTLTTILNSVWYHHFG